MKTISLIALTLAMTTSLDWAEALGQEGHGGGGVVNNGHLSTFYSAGSHVEPDPRSAIQVPGLNELTQIIQSFHFLSPETQRGLMSVVLPSKFHRYLKLDSAHLTPSKREQLVAEFSRATHQPLNKIFIFAFTDVPKKETYLLPEFYQLSTREQMTILFHEAYWLLYPESTLAEVIAAEMAFQSVVEKPESDARIYNFIDHLKSPGDLLMFSWNSDERRNARMYPSYFEDVVGYDYLKCISHNDRGSIADQRIRCLALLTINLTFVRKDYPASYFLRYLQESVDRSLQLNSEENFAVLPPSGWDLSLGFNKVIYSDMPSDHRWIRVQHCELSNPVLTNRDAYLPACSDIYRLKFKNDRTPPEEINDARHVLRSSLSGALLRWSKMFENY